MDSEMSDGTPVSPRLDARMLSDLREYRARHSTGIRHVTLTIDELDMFLRVAAERDTLRRIACEMPDDRFRAEIPDEIRERAEPAMRTLGICSRCGGRLYYSVPSHAWVHSGAVPKDCVPRPTPKMRF